MTSVRWLAGCLLLVLIFLVGCGGEEPESRGREGLPVPIFREFKGQQGPFPERAFMVIQRPEAWQALWGTQQAPRDIDFSRQSVIGALMGRQPTAGYTITIAEVRATGQRITVYVDEVRPTPGTTTAQVITYPYHMVVVPKITQPVSFVVGGSTAPAAPIVDQFTGLYSPVVNPSTGVIRSQQEWTRLWTATLGQTTATPEVDFTQNMAVVVLAGQRPSGGYAVSILSVTREDDRLVVRYLIRTPQPGETVTLAVTSPFAIAMIPASQLPIAFRDVSPRVAQ